MTDPLPTSPDLLPLRMLNEYAYCPRLFHLMHVEGRWADNQYTVEGRHVHRRVDALDHLLADAPGSATSATSAGTPKEEPKPEGGDEPPAVARSVPLASE